MATKEKKNFGPEFCLYCNNKEYILRKAGKTTVKVVEDTYGYNSEGQQTRYQYVDGRGNQATEAHRGHIYLPVCQSCWKKKERLENTFGIGFLLMLALGAAAVVISYLVLPDILWAKSDGFKLVGQLSFKGFLVRIGIFFMPFLIFAKKVGFLIGKGSVSKEFLAAFGDGGTAEYHQFIKDNNLKIIYDYEWEDQQ